MDAPGKSRFDLSQISTADKHNLAATFLEAALRFYEDPENLKRFERWQAKKEACASNANR